MSSPGVQICFQVDRLHADPSREYEERGRRELWGRNSRYALSVFCPQSWVNVQNEFNNLLWGSVKPLVAWRILYNPPAKGENAVEDVFPLRRQRRLQQQADGWSLGLGGAHLRVNPIDGVSVASPNLTGPCFLPLVLCVVAISWKVVKIDRRVASPKREFGFWETFNLHRLKLRTA